MMLSLENGMALTDYTPMTNTDQPVFTCDFCGCGIFSGEHYWDFGDIICDECMREHMKEA